MSIFIAIYRWYSHYEATIAGLFVWRDCDRIGPGPRQSARSFGIRRGRGGVELSVNLLWANEKFQNSCFAVHDCNERVSSFWQMRLQVWTRDVHDANDFTSPCLFEPVAACHPTDEREDAWNQQCRHRDGGIFAATAARQYPGIILARKKNRICLPWCASWASQLCFLHWAATRFIGYICSIPCTLQNTARVLREIFWKLRLSTDQFWSTTIQSCVACIFTDWLTPSSQNLSTNDFLAVIESSIISDARNFRTGVARTSTASCTCWAWRSWTARTRECTKRPLSSWPTR